MRPKIAKNIGVDAGLIMITDPSFYEKWGGKVSERKDLYKSYKVKNGEYRVQWSINNTWNGDVSGGGILKITSGQMIVSDPCYHFQEQSGRDVWGDLLDATNFLNDEQDGCVIINETGGDGSFDVRIEMEEIIV